LDSEISIFGGFRSTAQNTQSEPASSKQEPTSTQSFDAFNFGSTSSDAQEEPFMKQLSTSPRYFGGFKFGSTSSTIEKELDGNKQQSVPGHGFAWSGEFSDFRKKEQKTDGDKTSGSEYKKDYSETQTMEANGNTHV
jgi:hypothetical protein